MQNSVSDGDTNEQHQPYNSDTTPASYDEVFPALSAPVAAPAVQKAWGNTNSKLRVGSSTVTQIFVLSRAERRLENNGSFGENESKLACGKIMAETNTKIEISTGKDQTLTFLITGKQADVVRAQKKITDSFQQPCEVKIDIPKEFHKKLLGKGGERLKALEKSSECRIAVPSINDNSGIITISGPRGGVEKAAHDIKVIYDELSRQGFERISVPKIYHPFISGAYNINVQNWTNDLDVKVNLPPPSVSNDEITVAGTKENVQAVKDAILKIYGEMQAKCKQVSVEVPKSQHKYIIGPKGSFIHEILKETGVAVDMPGPEDNTDTITLRGPQEKLGRALTMVCDKSTSIKTVDIAAPAWLHKRLRGKKGDNIKRIVRDDPSIFVKFDDEKNSVRIEGPSEEVTRIENEIRKEIDHYLATEVREVLNVEPRFFKHIIGKQGSNINSIKEDTGAEISISEEGAQATITLEGSPDGVARAKAKLEEIISKLQNEKEMVIHIDARLIQKLKASEVRQRYPNVQLIFSGDKEVKLRGPSEEVDNCARTLREIAGQLAQDHVSIGVRIYKQYHRNIIGKQGATIKKIRDETNTQIDLPNENVESEDVVITGKKEDVLKAKAMIEKIQNDQANITQEEISIPSKFYTLLIGAGGRLIKSISEECGGVTIKFPDQASNSDRVIVRGPKDDVQKAVKVLDETRKELELASFTDTIKAKQQHHRFLIGKSGSTVKRIRSSTGARIMFPEAQDSDPDTIIIMGKKEAVASAKAELLQLIADIDNTVEDAILVDPEYHRHFVSRRGEVIQRITDECGGAITISFPRQGASPSDKVVLKGPTEAISMAKQKIEEEVNNIKSQVTIICVIPKEHHRTVMGKGGYKVRRVQEDNRVSIKFPNRELPGTGDHDLPANGDSSENLPGDVITISGQPEDCERAKQELLHLVPIVVKVNVPHELHRSIIGRSGTEVRQIMEQCDVRIDVPRAEEESDEITVSGAPDNVEKARLTLLEKVEAFEKDKEARALKSFKVTLEIDPEYHPKIIGRGGSVISKIRSDFDVQVNLPKRGSEDEHIITIVGLEENANSARDHILSIVNELKDRIKVEIDIDSRVHSRLIGQRGRTIRRLMDEFKVDIKFPRSTDSNPDLVTITGVSEENVLDAKEELLNQAEKLMDDVMDSYAPPRAAEHRPEENGGPAEGFRVTGAPWSQQTPNTESITDFPTFGVSGDGAPRGPPVAAWGPRR